MYSCRVSLRLARQESVAAARKGLRGTPEFPAEPDQSVLRGLPAKRVLGAARGQLEFRAQSGMMDLLVILDLKDPLEMLDRKVIRVIREGREMLGQLDLRGPLVIKEIQDRRV